MALRISFSGSAQVIEELCECCGEPLVGTVHVSEITAKHFKDERAVTIKDASNADFILKKKSDRIKDIQKERLAAGMLTASIVRETPVTESLRYGLRSEKMCSSSNGASTEFCYRVVNDAATASFKRSKRAEEFKLKFKDNFREKEDDTLGGLKVGMDRKGNPIRIISESFNDELNVPQERWFGAYKKQWYRDLDSTEKLVQLTASKALPDKKLQNYMFKKSLDLQTTASYYTNELSVVFDGTNDYIDLGDYSRELYKTQAEIDRYGMTVNAWIYIEDSGSASHPIISIGRNNNNYYGLGCRVSADFRLAMDMYGADRTGRFGQTSAHRKTVIQSNAVAPIKMYEDKWVMATFVYGTSAVEDWKIYLNGRRLTTITSGADDRDLTLTYVGTTSNIGRLGKARLANDSYYNGRINSVGVWYTPLDESNIKGLYNDGFPPDYISGSGGYVSTGSAQLLAYWPFDDGIESSEAVEKIQNRATRLTNGPSFEKTSPLDNYRKE